MIATLYLLGCVLAPAQTPPPVDARFRPHLARSQELLYRGAYVEEDLGERIQHSRSYRVETRVFVLDTTAKETELAFFTVLKNKDAKSAESAASLMRLERVHVDPLGKVSADAGVSLSVPLDGVPTVESGIFVEVASGKRQGDETWEVAEGGRPVRTWQIAGSEAVGGTTCIKVVGVQQSEDWDRPAGDHPAFRRTDTLWIVPRVGMATKVERVIEHKEAGHKEPSRRSVLRYEMDSNLQYPGQLSEDRRAEIQQAIDLRNDAMPLLATPGKYGTQLTTVLNKINYHLDHQTPTPYRDAVVWLKHRVEAAKRGEVAPQVGEDNPSPAAVAAIGQPAPDFLVSNFLSTKATRLRSLQGKPVLLLFYSPLSSISPDVLAYAEKMNTTYGQKLAVVAMAVSDDEDKVKKQTEDLKLTIPVLHGGGVRLSYGVETTPKLVLIDATGVVRGDWLGWGQATPEEVMAELKQWMK
jgi:peroxiredoxin